MSYKYLNRREFLRMSALTAAGLVAAGCGAPPAAPAAEATKAPAAAEPTKAAAVAATEAPAAAAPAAKEVAMDVMSLAEYEGPYKEIWGVFNAKNPGIKVNVFSINEDTAAAHEAKVAGGYLPAIELTQELQIFFNKSNYEMAVDLSQIDFQWWDRWQFDAKNAWAKLHNLPGPRSLDFFQGFVYTWQYNKELMDKAGLDPQKDVKTQADLEKWMDEGTKWAKSPDSGVDYFYNQAWHNGVFDQYTNFLTLPFADGQRTRCTDCWLGKIKFDADDSPYRHHYEFFLNAQEKGWMPENMTQRQWEGDMEASYIAGKSVMMLHGPWVWDKALAAGSEFAVNGNQAGIPVTPPAEGQDVWVQGALPPSIDNQWFMRAGVLKLPEWPQIETAWNWFFSPEAVPMRAQGEGRFPLYKLDEKLELQGPQFQAVLKEIGTPGGKWEQVKWEQELTGSVMASPYRKKGSKGVWDWESNGNNQVMADVLSGKITVKEALGIAQKNWEDSYEGMPTA